MCNVLFLGVFFQWRESSRGYFYGCFDDDLFIDKFFTLCSLMVRLIVVLVFLFMMF